MSSLCSNSGREQLGVVKHASENSIGAQALKAARLRRQLDRGELTKLQYLAALNALQETPDQVARGQAKHEHYDEPAGSQSSQVTSESQRPKLMGAIELLQLRRRLDNGELTLQEYLAQSDAHPHIPRTAGQEPASTDKSTPTAAAQMPIASAAVTAQVPRSRLLSMNCPRCAANLGISDETTNLQCGDCGADVVVERKDCTIALRIATELPQARGMMAPASDSARTLEAIAELRADRCRQGHQR